MGGKLYVNGDVSMEQNVDSKKDLHVYEKTNMDDDVFMKQSLCEGDVSMEQNLYVNGDMSMNKM